MTDCPPSRNYRREQATVHTSNRRYIIETGMICPSKIKTVAIALALAFVSSTHGAAVSGEITLKETDSFAKECFVKAFGDTLKATTSWRVGDFFGKQTVFAGVTVKNTGTKPLTFEYCVAFYDKNRKLIGAASQSYLSDDGMKPGLELQLGSCMIKLPKDKYKEIKFYEAVLYEMAPQPSKAAPAKTAKK